MQNDVEQVKALCVDAQGYLDKIMREAQDVAARASQLEPAAKEYDALVKKIAEKKGQLADLEADYKRAEQAFRAFQDLASKR